MPTRMLAGLIDFDGVLVDSEVAEAEVWMQLLTEYDLDPAAVNYVDYAGEKDAASVIVNYVTSHRDLEAKLVGRRLKSLYSDAVAELPLRFGMRDMLECLATTGIRLAVVTGSGYERVAWQLERLGIRSLFEHISAGASSIPQKPAPDLYLRALASLNLLPRQAFALEDSSVGAEAAVRAGLRVFVLPSPVTVSHSFPPEAIILTDPTELTGCLVERGGE